MAQVIVGCGSPFVSPSASPQVLRSSVSPSASPQVLRSSIYGESLPRTIKVPTKSSSLDFDKTSPAANTRASLSESPLRADRTDPFTTLGVNERASRSEVKSVYRRLALQYHPDVCVGDHCAMMFTQINQAYEKVMNYFHSAGDEQAVDDCLEGFYGLGDDSWDEWEEWMGWEGASGMQDYSSHINMNI